MGRYVTLCGLMYHCIHQDDSRYEGQTSCWLTWYYIMVSNLTFHVYVLHMLYTCLSPQYELEYVDVDIHEERRKTIIVKTSNKA